MTVSLYPSSLADYYPKEWNSLEYKSQLDLLFNQSKGEYLAVQDHEFIYLNRIEKIWQVVKGLFGFEDTTHSIKVNSELLKFFYYGEVNGFISPEVLLQLRGKVMPPNCKQFGHSTLQQLFKEIIERHTTSSIFSSDRLRRIHTILIDYHTKYATQLRPHFWFGLLHKSFLDSKKLSHFGDTPLALAQRALHQKVPDPKLALYYFLNAHSLQNYSVDFQDKFGSQFLAFLDQYKNVSEQSHIQDILLSLASVSFQNGQLTKGKQYLNYLTTNYSQDNRLKQRIGEIYLIHEQYDDIQSYLPLLEKAYAKQADRRKLTNAIDEAKWQLCKEHLAEWHTRLAQDLLKSNNSTPYYKIIAHLEMAVQIDLTEERLNLLVQTCIQAGHAENSRDVLRRNKPAAIEYYKKAFLYRPKNDSYLPVLLKLYLDNKQDKEAIKLYIKIQEQPWASQFSVTEDLYRQLAIVYFAEFIDTTLANRLKVAENTLEAKRKTRLATDILKELEKVEQYKFNQVAELKDSYTTKYEKAQQLLLEAGGQ